MRQAPTARFPLPPLVGASEPHAVCRVGRLPGYRRQRALAPHPPANLGVGAPLAIPAGHAHAPASIVPVIGDLRSNRLVCLRRDRGSYRAFVSVDVVLDLCVTGAECEPRLVNDAGLCVCVCPFVTMVRAGGSGHRRGTRSPLCSSEKMRDRGRRRRRARGRNRLVRARGWIRSLSPRRGAV